MKVIYFSNAYYPVLLIAGAIHSSLLPADKKLLTASKIDKIYKLWKKLKEKNFLFLGIDESGNHVFSMHYNCKIGLAKRLVESFLAMYNVKPEEYRFITFEKEENFLLKLGRFCGKIGLKAVERGLVQNSVQKIYPWMVALAERCAAGKESGVNS